jgi:hypothetical protein
MSRYPQIHVRIDTISEPLTTITIPMPEDSLATMERQLGTLERLIAQHGSEAFWGEPDRGVGASHRMT